MISEARKATPAHLRVPIRPTVADCVRCQRPIRPGELYQVLAEGPLHFGCEQHPSPAGAATPALAIADCDAHPSPARPGCDAGAGTPSKAAA